MWRACSPAHHCLLPPFLLCVRLNSFLVISSQLYRYLLSLPSAPQWVGGILWDLRAACVSPMRAIMCLHLGPVGEPPGPRLPLMPSTLPHTVLAFWSLVKAQPGSGKRKGRQEGGWKGLAISTQPAASPFLHAK